MLERTLSIQCKKYFDSLKKCKAIPKHQGAYTTQRGVSDQIICYRGKFIAIELKVGTNTTSDLQKIFGEEIKEAGGIFAVCYFLEEVKEVIRKVDRIVEIEEKIFKEWKNDQYVSMPKLSFK